MYKALLISAALAGVEARFGQEGLIQPLVQALGDFGAPGAAGTLAGRTPGVLLAGANPCDKLSLADDILTELGDDPQVIAAAKALVGAERNFNLFAVDTGDICADPGLPASVVLRGIVPKFDPAVEGSEVQNANAELSLDTPFDAEGLSVAEITIVGGFSNFVAKDAGGAEVALAGLGEVAAAGGGNNNAAVADDAAAVACPGVADAGADAADEDEDEDEAEAEAEAAAAVEADNGEDEEEDDEAAADNGQVDFGDCDPTIRFEGGLGNRPPTEFTFQSNDPKIEAIQGEALNPAIIVNRICDELTNQCGANQAAKDTCRDAQAQVDPQERSEATVLLFNGLLGF